MLRDRRGNAVDVCRGHSCPFRGNASLSGTSWYSSGNDMSSEYNYLVAELEGVGQVTWQAFFLFPFEIASAFGIDSVVNSGSAMCPMDHWPAIWQRSLPRHPLL